MTDQELLTLALTHLDATEHDLGDHGHYFSYQERRESAVVHIVNDGTMLILGELLADSTPNAYRIWCADHRAGMVMIDRVLDIYTERDPDVIVALATERGDVETLAALAHLRADFLRIAA